MNDVILANVEILWNFLLYEDKLEKSDIIIGFGSNDVSVAKRAAELYKDGWSNTILFTGGLGKGTDGIFTKSESEIFKDIAIDNGVSEESILIENQSTNSGENIQYSKKLLEIMNYKVDKAIIVHQPNMGRRIYAAIKKQWPEIKPIIAPSHISLNSYINSLKQTGISEYEIISNIVGDFQRIDVFAKKGFQIEQFIPTKTQRAFQNLCDVGYTKYIIEEE
jgi:uncharacterized SAM-binding protein YcdF (DUF218 family)